MVDARGGARLVPAPAPPRNALRHRGALGRLAEVGCAGNVLKLATKVRSVEDIERLEEQAKLALLAKVEVLGDAHIQLREAVAAHRIRRQVMLVVAVTRVAVNVDAVAVNVAYARREDAVRAG